MNIRNIRMIRNTRCLLWPVVVLSTLAMMKPMEVHAQVIMLPTTRTFSVGTSVSVPDRGFIGLGGVRYGALGRTSYGTPGIGMFHCSESHRCLIIERPRKPLAVHNLS